MVVVMVGHPEDDVQRNAFGLALGSNAELDRVGKGLPIGCCLTAVQQSIASTSRWNDIIHSDEVVDHVNETLGNGRVGVLHCRGVLSVK